MFGQKKTPVDRGQRVEENTQSWLIRVESGGQVPRLTAIGMGSPGGGIGPNDRPPHRVGAKNRSLLLAII
jgi:hypothetical protein